MTNNKIGNFEAIALILTIVINHTVLTLPKTIVSTTKSSSLINIVYVGIIAICISILICNLLKKFAGFDIIDVATFLGGNTLRNILGILFIVYFLFSAGSLLHNFCSCLQIAFYSLTNILFLILLFLIVVYITCNFGFNSIIKTNLLIVPIALLSIVFLFIANTKNFNLQRIFPILGDGFSATFVSGLSNLVAFSGIVFLYFLPPYLKESKKFKTIAVSSVIISLVYLLLSISTILFMFNFFTATEELMPLYSAARYIEFGNFFQRLDSVFLLIWIMSLACYVSILVIFSMSIMKKITNIKHYNSAIYPFLLIILGVSLLPSNASIATLFENVIYKYAYFILVLGISLTVLILANLKHSKIPESSNLKEYK